MMIGLGICGLALAGYAGGQHLGGPARPQAESLAVEPGVPAPAPEPPAPEEVTGRDGKGGVTTATIVESHRKRVLGRLKSYEHIERVATQMRPLVDRALEQRGIQDDLALLARRAGKSVAAFKQEFAEMQEADLVLESGGDPNARSVADAIGVAQFLAGTARMSGLRVDVAAGRSLGVQIAQTESRLAALAARPRTWRREPPAELASRRRSSRPAPSDASVIPTEESELSPGSDSAWLRDEWINYYRQVRQALLRRRMDVDQRYDPAAAIAAQTRHLVELTRSLGGIDWALQGYHGGAGGAKKSLALFFADVPAGLRQASADGGPVMGGGGLSYGEFYRRLHPISTPSAFAYIYGRSDDHRNYWWKVLMAHKALDHYRESPRKLKQEWEALHPGYYGDAHVLGLEKIPDLQFADNEALRKAYGSGALVRFPAAASRLGIRTGDLAPLQPSSAALHKGLRPPAMGALVRAAEIFRSSGGRGGLTVTAMVESSAYRTLHYSRYPRAPLPPGIPRDPDYHPTGYAFDIARPASDWDRKVLEFALGQLADSLRITWRTERGPAGRAYHVLADPDHAEELRGHYRRYASAR